MTAVALLAFATGCGKDFLTKAPVLSQSTELTMASYDGLNKATAGAYYYISSTGWYGSDWVIESEMRSGNGVKSNYKNSNRSTQGYTWNYTKDNTNTTMWAYCYYTVAMANNVIDNLEGKETSSVTTQDLNNIKAECLFLRAFAHFETFHLFGQPHTYQRESLGIPYVYHTDPAGKPERETVKTVYENAVADLLEAEKIIDPAYVRSGIADPLAAVNIYTIQALLSRIYLYMGEWQKSADYATKVINSGKFKMWTAEEYPTVWTADKGSGEVIFEMYGKRTNGTYGSWEDISYMTSPVGYGDPQVAPSLMAMYAEGDVRLKTFRTDEAGESGCWWTSKYAGKGDNAAPDCNNVVILRLSEMYLNRAEALVHGATVPGASAISDMNTITSNRGAAAYTSVGNLDIQNERRKELAWEGHYFFDMARWGKSLTRSADEYALCTMNLDVEFPSYKWALPIPKRERDLNENLKQNPGYGE